MQRIMLQLWSIMHISSIAEWMSCKSALYLCFWNRSFIRCYSNLIKPLPLNISGNISCRLTENWKQNGRIWPEYGKMILQNISVWLHVTRAVTVTLGMIRLDMIPHTLYSTEVVILDYHLFWIIQNLFFHQHFSSFEVPKMARFKDSLKRRLACCRRIPLFTEKMETLCNDGQFFE